MKRCCIDTEVVVGFVQVAQECVEDRVDVVGGNQHAIHVARARRGRGRFGGRREKVVKVDVGQIVQLGREETALTVLRVGFVQGGRAQVLH